MNNLLRSTYRSETLYKLPTNLVYNILKQSTYKSTLLNDNYSDNQKQYHLTLLSPIFKQRIRTYLYSNNSSHHQHNKFNYASTSTNSGVNTSKKDLTLKEKYQAQKTEDPLDGLEELSSKQVFKILETEYKEGITEFLLIYLNAIKNANQSIFLDIYEWVVKKPILNIKVFNLFLEYYSLKPQNEINVESIVEIMNSIGLNYDINTIHILLTYYSSCNEFDSLVQIFEQLTNSDRYQPNSDTIPTLIKCFGGSVDPQMQQLLNRCFNYMLRRPVLRTTVNFNLFIANSIQIKDTHQVKYMYNKMAEYSVQANIDTYYLLVSMYGQMGKFDTAHMIIRRVPHQLGHVDTLYASLLKSYIDHGLFDKAVRFFSKALNYSKEIAKPEPFGVITHGLLINNLDRDLEILIQRLREVNVLTLGNYNVILRQLSMLRSKETYLDLYCKMIETTRPTFLTFKSLIKVAIKSEDVQGCKILEQQILGELADFKVGLFRDIVKFYFDMRDFESLNDTVDYIFTAGHSVPNGVNHIFVHFEIEENQELVEYLIGKMSQCNKAFQSIHITKIIQLLLVTGNYQKALKWLELRENHFGIALDSFAILPFYFFHKLRGEYDLCNYWRAKANEKSIDLDVPQMFETYFKLNLNKDGSFLNWAVHTEGESLEQIYERINKPENLYLKDPKHSILDKQFASKLQENYNEAYTHDNVAIDGFYRETRKYNLKTTEEVILADHQSLQQQQQQQVKNKSSSNNQNNNIFEKTNVQPSEFNTTDIGTQTLVHVDFASRITYLLNESQKDIAMEETDQRENGGQFVGEFVYVTLVNYLIKVQDEPNARKYFLKLLEKQINPPSTLTHRLLQLTHSLGTIDDFIASVNPDLRKSYIDEKYLSYLLSVDLDLGLRKLQDSGREELLLFNNDYKNALTMGCMQNRRITMAEAIIQTIIRNKYKLQPMVVNEYINQSKLSLLPQENTNQSQKQHLDIQRCNPNTLISIKKYLQSRLISSPPELDNLLKQLNLE